MASTVSKSDLKQVGDLPLIKEWKVSRYFHKTVAQLHTELKNAPEITDTTSGQKFGNQCHNQKGLRSIPGTFMCRNYF